MASCLSSVVFLWWSKFGVFKLIFRGSCFLLVVLRKMNLDSFKLPSIGYDCFLFLDRLILPVFDFELLVSLWKWLVLHKMYIKYANNIRANYKDFLGLQIWINGYSMGQDSYDWFLLRKWLFGQSNYMHMKCLFLNCSMKKRITVSKLPRFQFVNLFPLNVNFMGHWCTHNISLLDFVQIL